MENIEARAVERRKKWVPGTTALRIAGKMIYLFGMPISHIVVIRWCVVDVLHVRSDRIDM
jgi:hypothetical protein